MELLNLVGLAGLVKFAGLVAVVVFFEQNNPCYSEFNVRWKVSLTVKSLPGLITWLLSTFPRILCKASAGSFPSLPRVRFLTCLNQCSVITPPSLGRNLCHDHVQKMTRFIFIYYKTLTTGPLCSPAVSGWHHHVWWWPHLYHTSGGPPGLGISQEPDKNLNVNKPAAVKFFKPFYCFQFCDDDVHTAPQTAANTLLWWFCSGVLVHKFRTNVKYLNWDVSYQQDIVFFIRVGDEGQVSGPVL